MRSSLERVRETGRRILHTHDTPERTAFAFALGAGIGFSPFLGFHYLIGIILAFAFGLNRLAVLAGITLNNPYTFLPITALCAQLGSFMIGRGWLQIPVPAKTDFLTIPAFYAYLTELRPLLLPFSVGSVTLSIVVFTISYFTSLQVIRRLRRFHALQRLLNLRRQRKTRAEEPAEAGGAIGSLGGPAPSSGPLDRTAGRP